MCGSVCPSVAAGLTKGLVCGYLGETEPIRAAKELDTLVGEMKARMTRLKEIGRAKEKELEKVTNKFQKEMLRVDALGDQIQQLKQEEQDLLGRCKELADRVIGQFVYEISDLSKQLTGEAQCSIKDWIETPDPLEAKRVRGEDHGVTAVQVELTWIVECSHYATRLSNIGNLNRIMGDKMSARSGPPTRQDAADKTSARIGPPVCNDYKKVEAHYNVAQSQLEASLKAMQRAKSIHAPQALSVLQAERAKVRGELLPHTQHDHTSDGIDNGEYLVVLENLALLHHARALPLVFPKGTPESIKTTFEGTRAKSKRRAVELLEEVLNMRSTLAGEGMGCVSHEFLRLLRILSQFHSEHGNFLDALPVQEKALQVAKKVHGETSAEAGMDMEMLSHLHLRLGISPGPMASVDHPLVVVCDKGSWIIDDSQTWHWDMVGKVRRKVQAACDLTHDFSRLQADLLQGNQQSMLKEKTRLLNPPPITDYSQVLEDDPMLKKAKVLKPPPPFLGSLSPVTAPCWCGQSLPVGTPS